jgi:endonuclease-8
VAEGDTIHYIAGRMRPVLEGKAPEEILAPQPRHAHLRWPERLAGRTIRSVRAYGKHLMLHFEGELVLHSHLRMSGAWGVYPPGRRWSRPARRAWIVIRASGVAVVQFDGPVLELVSESRMRSETQIRSLGQDVLAESFDEVRFLLLAHAQDQTRQVGDVLLDQRVIAGIGNVWKSEACFAARLDPWRTVGEVEPEQVLNAVRFARERMGESARLGPRARPREVYGRTGRPCPRCGAPIRSRGQGEHNRTTYWCPGCQR